MIGDHWAQQIPVLCLSTKDSKQKAHMTTVLGLFHLGTFFILILPITLISTSFFVISLFGSERYWPSLDNNNMKMPMRSSKLQSLRKSALQVCTREGWWQVWINPHMHGNEWWKGVRNNKIYLSLSSLIFLCNNYVIYSSVWQSSPMMGQAINILGLGNQKIKSWLSRYLYIKQKKKNPSWSTSLLNRHTLQLSCNQLVASLRCNSLFYKSSVYQLLL